MSPESSGSFPSPTRSYCESTFRVNSVSRDLVEVLEYSTLIPLTYFSFQTLEMSFDEPHVRSVADHLSSLSLTTPFVHTLSLPRYASHSNH